MPQKTVIIIGGPTASGKTSVAIALARHFGTEIISADSRQCFREMKIGVARPSELELATVPHHFIASHSIRDKVTAALFESLTLSITEQLFQQKDVVVMVGGTGLYIKAFCEGFDAIPEVPEAIRQEVRTQYEQNGLGWLQAELQQKDPQFYATGEIQNPQRGMRALEVFLATGNSIFTYRKGAPVHRPFNIIKIGLELPKNILHQQINERVDKMVAQGLLQEVKGLLPFEELNALQTVGYRELFAYFKGHHGLKESIEAIKQNTRQYAKRQLTWFKKDLSFNWFAPAATEEMIAFITQRLKQGA